MRKMNKNGMESNLNLALDSGLSRNDEAGNKFWGTTWKKLLAHVKKHDLIRRGDRVLVLVSGGPDSTAMACWLKLLSRRTPFEMAVLHVNHCLRADSARDAEAVRLLALKLGIPFYCRTVRVARLARNKNKSLEDAGREARYREAERLARRLGMNRVAAAHTLDEQAESVLINLLRGGSLAGLLGARVMRPVLKGSPVLLIRPLLGVSKKEVLDYLHERAIDYFRDPSNQDPRFFRSRIRLELIPKLKELHPMALEHLAGIGEKLGVK